MQLGLPKLDMYFKLSYYTVFFYSHICHFNKHNTKSKKNYLQLIQQK